MQSTPIHSDAHHAQPASSPGWVNVDNEAHQKWTALLSWSTKRVRNTSPFVLGKAGWNEMKLQSISSKPLCLVPCASGRAGIWSAPSMADILAFQFDWTVDVLFFFIKGLLVKVVSQSRCTIGGSNSRYSTFYWVLFSLCEPLGWCADASQHGHM
jgi:hypothetical protein